MLLQCCKSMKRWNSFKMMRNVFFAMMKNALFYMNKPEFLGVGRLVPAAIWLLAESCLDISVESFKFADVGARALHRPCMAAEQVVQGLRTDGAWALHQNERGPAAFLQEEWKRATGMLSVCRGEEVTMSIGNV